MTMDSNRPGAEHGMDAVCIETSKSPLSGFALPVFVIPILGYLVTHGATGRVAVSVAVAAVGFAVLCFAWRRVFHRIERAGDAVRVHTGFGVHAIPFAAMAWSRVVPWPLSFSYLVVIKVKGRRLPQWFWSGALETSAGGYWATVRGLRAVIEQARQ